MSFIINCSFPRFTFPSYSFQGYIDITSIYPVRARVIAFPLGYFSSLVFPKYAFQEYVYQPIPTRREMAEISANKVSNNVDRSNCWSLYNKEYIYRQFLSDLSRVGSNFQNFINTDEVPEPPDLNDYDRLDC